MADNVAITAGSGTTIATDEVAVNGGSTGHVQYVKLVDGTGNGTDGVPGGAAGLYVQPRYDLTRIAVNSGGLTIATTAYTAGDQVGTQFTLANAARASGGSGMIRSVVLTSAADIIGAFDVVFMRSSITLASDNAAFAISDTDALAVVGIVQLAGALDIGNNRIAAAYNLAVPYDCSGGTSLYAALITRVGHTFFAAVTDLQLQVFVERN
jgi:hypothetical protein